MRLANSKEYYVRHPDQMRRLYLIGRLLAAVMGAVGVLLLFFCARILFDSRVALFSAVALATTALWVRDAHFMLVNVPSAMWMIAAALAPAGAVRRVSARALLLSAFLAGLAASTKYPAGAAVALTAYAWVRTPLSSKRLLAPALVSLSLLGFVVGTPYAIVEPGEFLRALSSEGRDKLSFVSPSLIASQFVLSQGAVAAILAAAGA